MGERAASRFVEWPPWPHSSPVFLLIPASSKRLSKIQAMCIECFRESNISRCLKACRSKFWPSFRFQIWVTNTFPTREMEDLMGESVKRGSCALVGVLCR